MAIGSSAYRFRTEGKSLLADTIDLTTLEQQQGVSILELEEEIRGIFPQNDGVILYTDSTVVRLGKNLRELLRKPLPSAVQPENMVKPIFRSDLSYMAFSLKDGLFLCELAADAQPQLLRKHWKGETVVEYDYLYPLAFLGEDRLYVAAEMWEASAGYYLIMDYAGNELKRLDYYTTGEISGGYHSYNQELAIYY